MTLSRPPRKKPHSVPEISRVKIRAAIILLAGATGLASGAAPLPKPRPADAPPPMVRDLKKPDDPPPSACRIRLTEKLAIAPSVPPVTGTNGCGIEDAVRLEAVVLPDGARVALAPPAVLRCSMAEAIVEWVRTDIASLTLTLGSALRGLDNYASYHCRSRNNIRGAILSEHGKGNALDIRLIRLANRTTVAWTDPSVSKEFREKLRRSACARFRTVLGPGADGYHETHVHVDLQERRSGYRMCQWDVREPGTVAGRIPLPRPRPTPG
jgi:hypothetical protein